MRLSKLGPDAEFPSLTTVTRRFEMKDLRAKRQVFKEVLMKSVHLRDRSEGQSMSRVALVPLTPTLILHLVSGMRAHLLELAFGSIASAHDMI